MTADTARKKAARRASEATGRNDTVAERSIEKRGTRRAGEQGGSHDDAEQAVDFGIQPAGRMRMRMRCTDEPRSSRR